MTVTWHVDDLKVSHKSQECINEFGRWLQDKYGKLADVLSTDNPLYMQLLEEQLADKFRHTCQTCDFYRSIHKKVGTAADDETETRYYNLAEVKRKLTKQSSEN